ncbi:MAG: hypothetical protein AMJ58_02735 [Gammaproteobacteria bacterium SG8_30]|nr:MAG: hypothetical protein AMJ58_02735 [Gammaproteobacteria bacterium SG8_30]
MLLARILTALVLVVLLVLVLFALPPAAAVLALGALTLAGAWEWAAFAGVSSPAGRAGYVAACAVVMSALWLVAATPAGFAVVMIGALAWWLAAFGWVVLAPGKGRPSLAALAGLAALAPMWVALEHLYAAGPEGRELIIFVLVLAGAADVGAYFAGRRFGRHKLAPRVSPNKTWEGVLGGLLASALVAWFGHTWFGLPTTAFVTICVAAVLASIVGDLTESMFKRKVGLKDSGSILPGHGGVLDRIDSLTAAVPVFALGLAWMGALP